MNTEIETEIDQETLEELADKLYKQFGIDVAQTPPRYIVPCGGRSVGKSKTMEAWKQMVLNATTMVMPNNIESDLVTVYPYVPKRDEYVYVSYEWEGLRKVNI